MYSRIVGTGSYLPKKILTNRDLEKVVDTSHEWIVTRTGIEERRVAADDQRTSDLALEASRAALQAAGIQPNDLGLIVVATTTPDYIFPSTACILQSKLGIDNTCPAFDIQAVCGGFVYALATADLYLRAGRCRYALVVGSEIYSRILDWTDRSTCVLFGDGAGAVVLAADKTAGILAHRLHADGRYSNTLAVPGQICSGQVTGRPYVVMEGGAVFKFAVKALGDIVEETLAEVAMKPEDVDWLIPHQANIRIIQATAKRLGLPMERVVVTVDKHGNTSAASIPLALDIAVRDGRVRPGQHVVLEGIGGGFTWGAVLIRW
ncbi:beta-ketoacyl-ACP synthase III [Pelomicrobium methylotrophicum]|uniref:Beta-ketoacyl-[acyl-carrier-protein] synthase III n=1 Tax=Pelomicrobium methylotrophicum TaxID=2602750 RepID=A0A5C7EWZ1_9PROT|nr:beta-ketoacyl-ACP synthase III [Pelomicrobium methylotrophicum]TXF13639.1 ketoacyl-ACP synthase III [Pelomicrobium methylotrophicum]